MILETISQLISPPVSYTHLNTYLYLQLSVCLVRWLHHPLSGQLDFVDYLLEPAVRYLVPDPLYGDFGQVDFVDYPLEPVQFVTPDPLYGYSGQHDFVDYPLEPAVRYVVPDPLYGDFGQVDFVDYHLDPVLQCVAPHLFYLLSVVSLIIRDNHNTQSAISLNISKIVAKSQFFPKFP